MFTFFSRKTSAHSAKSAIPPEVVAAVKQLRLPQPASHKGENGKLLFIGGSELFHAPVRWSLDTASRFVDMLFYASVPQNEAALQHAKQEFWNGIVVPQGQIDQYATEAEVILIGPGMERTQETARIVNTLLTRFPQKKWVVDAGALQMADPRLFGATTLITPHQKELQRVADALSLSVEDAQDYLCDAGVTLLAKGSTDYIQTATKKTAISGGNAGMTKGGTGDVLAGLVAGLFVSHTAEVSAIVGSYVNKMAATTIAEKNGPFFNASDLAGLVPETLYGLYSDVTGKKFS